MSINFNLLTRLCCHPLDLPYIFYFDRILLLMGNLMDYLILYKNLYVLEYQFYSLIFWRYYLINMIDIDFSCLIYLDIMFLVQHLIILMTFLFSMLHLISLYHNNRLYLYLNLLQIGLYYLMRRLNYEDEISFDDLVLYYYLNEL